MNKADKYLKETICGIYKITSPSGRVYIGESIDINKRLEDYKKESDKIKQQQKIYNSIKKYGSTNHIFEIVEECPTEDLKCRERYWQDFYDVLGENGLNLKLTECGELKQVHSIETIKKMSLLKKKQYLAGVIESNWKYAKKVPHSEATKLKISEANIGSNNGMFGKKEDLEHKNKRMKNLLNTPKWNKGLSKETDDRLNKLAQKLRGRVAHNKMAHSLTDNCTNEIWESDSLKGLSLICPLSLATLNRLKKEITGEKIKNKYILKVL